MQESLSQSSPEFQKKLDKFSFIGQDVSSHDVLSMIFPVISPKNPGITLGVQIENWHYLCCYSYK